MDNDTQLQATHSADDMQLIELASIMLPDTELSTVTLEEINRHLGFFVAFKQDDRYLIGCAGVTLDPVKLYNETNSDIGDELERMLMKASFKIDSHLRSLCAD